MGFISENVKSALFKHTRLTQLEKRWLIRSCTLSHVELIRGLKYFQAYYSSLKYSFDLLSFNQEQSSAEIY